MTQVAPRGFGDDIGQDLGVDAECLADAERLGDRDEGRAGDQIVAELGDLAGADGADMDDVGSHCRQCRPRFFEIAGLAADHDRQGAGRRAADPARDRRIEKAQSALLEPGRHALRGAGIDRRHVDAQPSG